jgi:hypothetical protein
MSVIGILVFIILVLLVIYLVQRTRGGGRARRY